MNPADGQRTCLITGSRGYLGGCVKSRFQSAGWKVVELTRNPGAEEVRAGRAVPFQLGGEISAEQLRGADALVHCAHDFSLRDWPGIHQTNVLGAEKLFEAARAAGAARQIFISSMSAYNGCESLYGRAKLEVEKRVVGRGVLLLRPGLIYGDRPSGIFGNLVKRTKNSTVLPLFGGGRQVLYLTHEEDLCEVILAHAAGTVPLPGEPGPVTVAHEKGWPIRAILEGLAQAQGRKLKFVPAPWRAVWLAMKGWEACGLPAKFRSDSLLSLMHQNEHPSFELTRRLGLKFRAFQPESLKF